MSAPQGACEFIDLHIPSIVQYGGRYIVATLHSFTNQPYCNLPECFMGWMMRKKPGSGEIFEPSTVANKIDVAKRYADRYSCYFGFGGTYGYLDRSVPDETSTLLQQCRRESEGMVLMGKAMTTLRKADLYDLFMPHAKARGEWVDTADQAETIFSVENGVTHSILSRLWRSMWCKSGCKWRS